MWFWAEGGVCDYINHFGYYINEIWILKGWGAAVLKGSGENTAKYIEAGLNSKHMQIRIMYQVTGKRLGTFPHTHTCI